MSWTEPKTWVSEIVSASDLNEQVRDNLIYLYDQIGTSLHFEVVDITSAGVIVSMPSYSVVLEVLVYVTTGFNAAVSIGDVDNNEGFMTAAQVNATVTGWKGEAEDDRGAYLWSGTRRLVKGYHQARDVQAYTTGTGALKAFIMYGK